MFTLCVALSLLASVRCVSVRVSEEKSPFHDRYRHSVDGFELSHVYLHTKGSDFITRHEVAAFMEPSFHERTVLFATNTTTFGRLQFVKALAMMNEQTYPEWQTIDGAPPEQQGFETSEHNQFAQELTSVGENLEQNIFDGLQASNNAATQAGVHALVYRRGSMMCIVFQGAYSNLDSEQIGLWFKNWFFFKQADESLAVWLAANQSRSQLPPDIGSSTRAFIDLYDQLIVQADLTLYTKTLMNDLTGNTGLAASSISNQGYYAVAKSMAAEVIAEADAGGYNLTIVGHSMGGLLGSLVSMYYVNQGRTFDTVTFAAVGSLCLAYEKFSDEIDVSRTYTNIRRYKDFFDLYALIDYSPGTTCYMRLDQYHIDNYCSQVFGYGVNLLVAPIFQPSLALTYLRCRWAHNLFHIINALNTTGNFDPVTAESIPYPCTPQPVADAQLCGYRYESNAAGLAFFVLANVVVALVVICSPIVASCYFCCYKKRKCCWKNKPSTVQPADEEGTASAQSGTYTGPSSVRGPSSGGPTGGGGSMDSVEMESMPS